MNIYTPICQLQSEVEICGWYTPNYEIFLSRLIDDIDKLGFRRNFMPVSGLSEHWEENTRLKPIYMKRALEDACGRTVLFVDVDCRLLGSKEQIESICDIKTDISLRFSGKVNRSGKLKMHPWSGTMVLRPTEKTFQFLDAWMDLRNDVHTLTTDEATLGVALTRVPNLSVTMMHPDACAGAGHPDPIIYHPHRTGVRASKWMKILRGISPF
jgi:hypothetical protein